MKASEPGDAKALIRRDRRAILGLMSCPERWLWLAVGVSVVLLTAVGVFMTLAVSERDAAVLSSSRRAAV